MVNKGTQNKLFYLYILRSQEIYRITSINQPFNVIEE